MINQLLERQAELPTSIPLFRYAPDRANFSWESWTPAATRSAEELPQYLILGNLDPSSFAISDDGWSACWQGAEETTHFDVSYHGDDKRWVVGQTWRGIDGGSSYFSARTPLNKVIAQGLYARFPDSWDSAAKTKLEEGYQVSFFEQPKDAYTFCGIPDGAFRTIVAPIAVGHFQPIQQWLKASAERLNLNYPVSAEAKLLFQAVNFLEGKAPDWTSQDGVVFNQSLLETGLVPQGLPVREEGNDGSAAWTLRRQIYFMHITLPFAWLTDFLQQMSTENGPIRAANDPELRFDLRPFVIPAGFEMQTESLAFWDHTRTTRSFIQFNSPDAERGSPIVEYTIENESNAASLIEQAEEISREVTSAFEELLGQGREQDT
jgi:hypothetical protein